MSLKMDSSRILLFIAKVIPSLMDHQPQYEISKHEIKNFFKLLKKFSMVKKKISSMFLHFTIKSCKAIQATPNVSNFTF